MFAANYEIVLREKGGGGGEGGERRREGQRVEAGCGGGRWERGESSGCADRGPFIHHARADRELAMRDTAHKSETITPS